VCLESRAGSGRRLAAGIAAFFVFGLTGTQARAAAGLSLNWNDCPLGPTSQVAMIGPCQSGGESDLFASFELASPVDSVIALEAVIDVQSEAAVLPAWWQYAPGGCRFGSLIERADFPVTTACADFWQNGATFAGPPGYTTGAPRGGSNQARIVASFAVLSTEARALVAGTRYYAARLVFTNDVGAPCPGCEIPACLLLNSIRLIRISGEVDLESPTAPNSNRAVWQSLTATCDAVPARRMSWGRIKMLYR
jgi:hypothetical protein